MDHGYFVSILLFTVPLWVHHLTYGFSQTFLIKIIIGSFPTYDMLSENVKILEV